MPFTSFSLAQNLPGYTNILDAQAILVAPPASACHSSHAYDHTSFSMQPHNFQCISARKTSILFILGAFYFRSQGPTSF